MALQTRILLVEDEESLRHSMATMLMHHGFTVEVATNVPEALDLISRGSYDVLLSDLSMPGPGDGLTVIDAMQRANPATITLLMSGDVAATSASLPLKPNEILRKPLRMLEVVHLIQQKLGMRETHRADLVASAER